MASVRFAGGKIVVILGTCTRIHRVQWLICDGWWFLSYCFMCEIMDLDTESTTTSIDDKTEDFCENPTRDTLAEGLMCLLKPTIDQLDERVRATRISQVELKQQIEVLSEELKKISESQQCPLDIELYIRKLINAKLKVTVVSNILQTVQDRLNKVHIQIEREQSRRRALLEPSPTSTPLEATNPSIQ